MPKLVESFFLFVLFAVFSVSCFANSLNSSFYSSEKTRQYFSIGGRYKSEHQNKDEDLFIDYLFRSNDKIFEFEFNYDGDYRYKSSKKSVIKTKNESEGEFSGKFKLGESKNYFLFFSRLAHDDLAKYYYNFSTLAGFGRFIFNDNASFDFAVGNSYTKDIGSDYIYRGSFSLKKNLTDKIIFSQKYIFTQSFQTTSTKARVEEDNQFRNQLSFKIGQKSFLQLRYDVKQDKRDPSSGKRDNDVEHEYKVSFRIRI